MSCVLHSYLLTYLSAHHETCLHRRGAWWHEDLQRGGWWEDRSQTHRPSSGSVWKEVSGNYQTIRRRRKNTCTLCPVPPHCTCDQGLYQNLATCRPQRASVYPALLPRCLTSLPLQAIISTPTALYCQLMKELETLHDYKDTLESFTTNWNHVVHHSSHEWPGT